MTELDWEVWLAERFPRYLLYDAAGGPRDPAHVAHALEQLAGTPGAWNTLAELGFLLDPAGETEAFVLAAVPAWLRNVLPTTRRHVEEAQGRMRGRTDWPRTLRKRLQTRDGTWFVGTVPERTFETPGAIVVRWLLDQILRAIADLRPSDLSIETGWLRSLSQMHLAATEALRHAALRDIPVRRPDEAERQHCSQSHDPALRQAARVLGFCEQLLPEPTGDALQRTVERFALAPTNVARRFELFTLLSVLDAVDELLEGWQRSDELLVPGAKAVATWRVPGASVRVIYDKGTPPGVHADVMSHYFGLQVGVRPDLRLVFEAADERRELYLDAKCSTEPGYLAQSHLKMLAYIADRPKAFGPTGPKVIITTPREATGPIRPNDAVVFLGPSGCRGHALRDAVVGWMGVPAGTVAAGA